MNFQHEEKNDFCRTQNVLFLVSHTILACKFVLNFYESRQQKFTSMLERLQLFWSNLQSPNLTVSIGRKTQMNWYLLYCTCSLIHMRNGQLRIEFLKIQHIPLLGPKCFYIGYKLIHLYLDQTQPGL